MLKLLQKCKIMHIFSIDGAWKNQVEVIEGLHGSNVNEFKGSLNNCPELNRMLKTPHVCDLCWSFEQICLCF